MGAAFACQVLHPCSFYLVGLDIRLPQLCVEATGARRLNWQNIVEKRPKLLLAKPCDQKAHYLVNLFNSALGAALQALHAAANGTCLCRTFLSSLDPGIQDSIDTTASAPLLFSAAQQKAIRHKLQSLAQ
jgi:hypothetical protein